ncbi:MAG: hypothetical protein LWY06_05875 [Firmicutes bacterium]|nr:hypothetical protein [Bacillota bacterium]
MNNRKLSRILTAVIALLALMLTFVSVTQAKEKYSDDTVKNFIAQTKLYSSVNHKNLTIIPVKAPYSSAKGTISTFDEAVAEGSLIIKEVSSSGSVNQLAVINQSDDPVYIMAGEILRGSKQDRVLKDDVLVPAKSGKILVDCFCVEHGRWTYKSDKFYSGGQNANISVRQAAKQTQDQSEVWNSVAKTNASFNQEESGSLAKSYESKEVTADKKAYINEITDIPSRYPEANGVVVMINGKVLAADIFSDPRIFRKLWKKLSDSYALEAISKQNDKSEKGISSAKEFLSKVQSAEISYAVHPGLGRKVEIKSAHITGSGLVSGGAPIHIDLFPKLDIPERPKSDFHRNYDQRNQINAPNQIQQQE